MVRKAANSSETRSNRVSQDLLQEQDSNRREWYAANVEWWVGGYGGSSDAEAMIGDEGGDEDGQESLKWLDEVLAKYPTVPRHRAVDAGAGVGRVTRSVLLKRFTEVKLIEADSGWSKRSRVYLGHLVWVQWTLQYLTDRDVVKCLQALAAGLSDQGLLIIKENRPYGSQRPDRFFMEVPEGEQGRFDITRPDNHHRLLFRMAGLEVLDMMEGDETHSYACRRQS